MFKKISLIIDILKLIYLYSYFSSTRLMSPEAYRFGPVSQRGGFDGVDMRSFHKEQHHQEGEQETTPRYVSTLGKNAYALAFGSADLTKILLFSNSG